MALFQIIVAISAASAPDICMVDEQAMLKLEFRAFDQDMNGGWRALSKRPECRTNAADVIRLYREQNEARTTTLLWHEGQLRAEAGEIDQAITLMTAAAKKTPGHGRNQEDWNAYVDATVAFLKGDREQLLAARERLAQFPVPEGYLYKDAQGEVRTGRPPGWPFNLDVVDGLIRCFGRSYEEAYGSPHCRHPRRP
ncbi:hypothetical protein SH591_00545 [Sphingomonas sp. LY54]|uniref:hypothetical protein n=1 Tax=Sphingomonas sp. LY54 TaxID=3095343 RepID=UPI002D794295|nr:hypothetical protein [Sphingomonas sp. LY54]WRP28712.1 hypothetical protein SH591_00545 [Sphingomonas sp. LY54]